MDSINSILNKFKTFGIQTHSLPNAIGLWPNEQECIIWAGLNANINYDWLEIGSFCGGSAVLLCLTQQYMGGTGSVVSVDNNFNAFFDYNVYKRGKFNDIHKKLKIDSIYTANHITNKISLAFIDGYHSFIHVCLDFEGIYPLLTEDAIVIFHDVSPNITNNKDKCLRWVKKQNIHKLITNRKNNEDFRIDEAVHFICKKFNFDIIDIPVKKNIKHFKETKIEKWIRGKTSPFNAIAMIRKINENKNISK